MGRRAKGLITGVAAALAAGAAALAGLRWTDARSDATLAETLLTAGGPAATSFDPAMLEGLPDPARRFFRFAIAPGTPLRTAAVIEMAGTLDLGTRAAPDPKPMRAHQVLAPPHGFLWRVRTGGAMRVTGSDALLPGSDGPDLSWSRFRILDAVPVGRAGGADHLRSSFGRMVGEGLFWTPAAFLPAAGAGWDAIEWRGIDARTAEVRVRAGTLEQSARVTVAEDGRPVHVVFDRWSDENPDRTWQVQPFGGDLSGFETFGGFRLPTRVTGGNHYGTDLYHPFFRAEVAEVRFPGAP